MRQICILYCAIMFVILIYHCYDIVYADWNDETKNEGTLKLIQIVHTHGDRTPSHFVNDDPFIDQTKYWPEGVGQLTKKGRQQMYEIGRYINENYKKFIKKHLHDEIIEKAIHAQSSATGRCLESTTMLLQGLINEFDDNNDENNFYQNNITLENEATVSNIFKSYRYETLSKYWRPIPIKSSYPKGTNPILDSSIECPNLNEEINDLKRFDVQLKKLWKDNAKFIDDISHHCGESLDNFDSLYELLHELTFEQDRNLTWSTFKIWSKDFERKAIDQLYDITQEYLQVLYSNRKIQVLSVGLLLSTLGNNLRTFLQNQNGPKIYVYGTYDSKIVTLLDALDLIPEDEIKRTINGGSALVIELREFQDQYFIRTFYIEDPFGKNNPENVALFRLDLQSNKTILRDYLSIERFSESFCFPELPINQKHLRCPIANFFEHIKPLEPFDWPYQCGIRTRIINIFAANFAILAANLSCVIFLIFALKIYSSRIRLQAL